ncbi:HRDC domain-containing protein, partial [Streptomyces galbus]|uniref:HRDC domain-containing protein n=1 Tax=Streptomyces galbus TaxID=33898 RepID=UPI001FFAB59C
PLGCKHPLVVTDQPQPAGRLPPRAPHPVHPPARQRVQPAPRAGAGAPGAGGGVGRASAGPPRTGPPAVPRRAQRSPARCRVCGRTLTDGGELKLLRCEDCPSDMDEGLYERLRSWRAVQARRSGQPAFCVFTDKTLMAIAETVPEEPGELARIPGVGVRKLNRYGADVLALCAGQDLGGEDEEE